MSTERENATWISFGMCWPGEVFCPRTGSHFDVPTHRRCPYCQGGVADILTGRHREFCDYRPERDPVRFGFSEDSVRLLSG